MSDTDTEDGDESGEGNEGDALSLTPEPIGSLSVHREKGAVLVAIEYKEDSDDSAECFALQPEDAVAIATHLQSAAADAKRYGE